MRSLRARALAGDFALVGILVAAMLLLSRQVVVSEFDRFVTEGGSRLGDEVVAAIQAEVNRRGSLNGIGEALVAIHERTSAGIVLLRDGAAIAGVPALPVTINVAAAPDGAPITAITFDDSATRSEVAFRGPLPEIVDAGGRPLVSVIVISNEGSGGRLRFSGEVNRGLLWIALGIAALGIVLSGWLAARLVQPVERLTTAARRLAAGDLSQRVTVDRRDELGQLAEAFNGMAAGVERNEQLRRSLLNDVAHELRTPLTHVRAELEALQDGLRQPTRDVIDRLHADARHLERLVDDLRDLAQAEAGRLRLAIEAVPLARALRDAAASVTPLALAKQVRIETTVGEDAAVKADPARLRQVIVNLLDNAVRYAPPGTTVGLTATTAPAGRVQISVTDEGPGVPEGQLPRLFDRFFRGDESRDRRTGGVGLGLAIVRQLVALQGGTVEAANQTPHGLHIRLTLPHP
jgi:two-component system sensor histidine kinase BaeS